MDRDYPAPPPYSEAEYDQKVSRATELSLQSSRLSLPEVDEEGWPRYDPEAFEAISANFSNMTVGNQLPILDRSGSSSRKGLDRERHDKSTPLVEPTRPLRVEKKSKPPQLPSQGQYSSTEAQKRFPATPYTRVPASDPESGNHGSDFSPNSPLASPPTLVAHLPAQPVLGGSSSHDTPNQFTTWSRRDTRDSLVDPYYYHSNHPLSPRQSLPAQPNPPRRVAERPASSYSPAAIHFQNVSTPRLAFNPSIAYEKPAQSTAFSTQSTYTTQPIRHDAHALYHSSVSAQLTSVSSAQVRISHVTPIHDQRSQFIGQGPGGYATPMPGQAQAPNPLIGPNFGRPPSSASVQSPYQQSPIRPYLGQCWTDPSGRTSSGMHNGRPSPEIHQLYPRG